MRLHSLEVSAFGPFAETVTVDFDRLGADGLFLLHGDTGAGKTTVLDAVAFALYGTVPGARKDGKRLLSDHAPTGSVPKVVLEATIGSRRLRLVRSPEFERPKRRGVGFIVENAKATLAWLDGHGENLSRIPDIAEEIGRLMGMSADQFFQVVLLPQGEFARFLRADNEERGQLLERLFDTNRFGTVEEWFLDRRRRSAADLEGHQRSVDLLSARVGTAAGIEGGADADPTTWARKLTEEARETRDACADDVRRIKDEAKHARAALDEARRVLDLQHRRRRAEEELARFDAGAAERSRIADELSMARRAEPVAALCREAEASRECASEGLRSVAAIESRLRGIADGSELLATLSWPPAAADRDRIRSSIRGWQNEIVRLDAALAEDSEADRREAEVADLRRVQKALADTAASLTRECEELPVALAAAECALDAAQKSRAAVPALTEARDRASDAAAAAAELCTRRIELDDRARDVLDAREEHQNARERWLDLLQCRISGMAAELAATLEDGKPCQVCGSANHPEPARSSALPVTDTDENSAREAERLAAAALIAAGENLAAVERAIGVLTQRSGGGDADQLAGHRASAEMAVAEAAASGELVEQCTEHLTELRTSETRLREDLRAVGAESATVAEKIGAGTEALSAIRARTAVAAGSDGSVTARRDRLDTLAATASDLLDARDRGAAADTSARELTAKVSNAVRAAGFDTVEHAVAAVRAADRLDEIDRVLNAVRDAEVSARAVLADPVIDAVAGTEPVELTAVERASEDIAIVLEAAVAAAAEADRRLLDLERLGAQLDAAVADVSPMQAAHDELAGLADVVAGRGQNARKMSLRSYVLAARLEEVAVSASARFARMSGGRYEFVHSDEAGPRGRRGGLGLDIRDDYTGAVRSAKTLSGGESFLASLSLALGLADVVAAESGGVVLDTMFIDEGFGTLDADTLDSVMGVLDELRDGGRVVGIVSHVDEMRQRIPSRLHVIRGRNGSTLEVIAG